MKGCVRGVCSEKRKHPSGKPLENSHHPPASPVGAAGAYPSIPVAPTGLWRFFSRYPGADAPGYNLSSLRDWRAGGGILAQMPSPDSLVLQISTSSSAIPLCCLSCFLLKKFAPSARFLAVCSARKNLSGKSSAVTKRVTALQKISPPCQQKRLLKRRLGATRRAGELKASRDSLRCLSPISAASRNATGKFRQDVPHDSITASQR